MELKKAIVSSLPVGSDGRWLLSCLYRNPFSFLSIFIRSLWVTKKLTGRFLPIAVKLSKGQVLSVNKAKDAVVKIGGSISVESWGGVGESSTISILSGATFQTGGDFAIGPGVHIFVGRNAFFRFGGINKSSGSGITCNTRIMVEEYLDVGADAIIAWDVFITDSDWHNVEGSKKTIPVHIGDHVWISHGVSILKGARIPDGCIVGAKTLVSKGDFEKNSLIAGAPARVCKNNVQWSR